MFIASYNKLPSRIDFYDNVACMYPNTMLAEKFVLAGSLSYEIISLVNFEQLTDELIFLQLLIGFQMHENYVENVKAVKEMHPRIMKLIRTRAKDKLALELIGKYRSLMHGFRRDLKEYFVEKLTFFKVIELVGFAKDESWSLNFPFGDYQEEKEDEYIPTVTKTIAQHGIIMSFDSVVEQLFTFTELGFVDDAPFDFIKIPTWDFPLMEGIKFNQIKFTQQELKQPMQEFSVHMDDLLEQLFQIPFSAAHHAEIINLCNEKIVANAPPVQNAIDNSLYMIQFRNQNPAHTGMKFHFGITSAANLVDYFGKSEMVQPYVASEIKERLQREINLEASCVFSYFIINKLVD